MGSFAMFSRRTKPPFPNLKNISLCKFILHPDTLKVMSYQYLDLIYILLKTISYYYYIVSFFMFCIYRGCTRATITFFRYDYQQERLITIRVIPRCNFNVPTLISCMHLSQDKFSRHLAFSTYSPQACILKVWRIEDPPEYPWCPKDYLVDSNTIQVTETLIDSYNDKLGLPKCIIKVRIRII